jgi:hypothetical protein
MRESMKIMGKWFESCEELSEEAKKEVYYWVIRHSIFEEEIGEVRSMEARLALSFIVPQIDNMINSYDKQKEMGRKGGRPSLVDNDEVVRLAVEESLNGAEIAERLGVKKSTLYSSEGWKKSREILKNTKICSENSTKTEKFSDFYRF